MSLLALFAVLLGLLFPVKASDFTHKPRVTLTDKDVSFLRIQLSGNNSHIDLLHGPHDNIVYATGHKNLFQANFHNSKTSRMSPVFGEGCRSNDPRSPDCHYNITVLRKTKDPNQLFLCGTNGQQHTLCCYMNPSDDPFICTPSKGIQDIGQHINEREPSLLIVSSEVEEFYITHSGTEGSVGINRFGKNMIWTKSGTEQRYVSLVASGQREDRLQDRLYAFYIEKIQDPSLDSDLWVPRVAQVCMADIGGPKGYLQFKWTSKLSARLFCGEHGSRLSFTQLVDVNTVLAERWQDTRVYALFRNGWGMSAVCVYTIADIDRIFKTSNFKGHTGSVPSPRPGECVKDSTKIPMEVLKMVDEFSEMEEWVTSGPLLVTHQYYHHICVDSVQGKGNVLFLSLENGEIHKILERDGQVFVIAELQPFNYIAHILSMMLQSSTGKLYLGSSRELVQIDLDSCEQYGAQCEDCVLARDPYCGWDGNHCTTATNKTIQDVENGNHQVCSNISRGVTASKVYFPRSSVGDGIRIPLSSKYFLNCPTLSSHAEYSWRHHGNTTATPCISTGSEHQCLLLIESMGPEQQGTYSCVSEERGYHRTLVQYQLQLDSGATGLASPRFGCLGLVLTLVLTLLC
ncbi:semaphorin-7A-like isoform X1 [Salvelinus fontinalis]|uniref:semaphorin-7A-like isoform X1 n=1 Tax=Salvelinus fontinalis TaxID=8038 RepID=UPI0024856746|nr:semaphorin-7A-like isoform X1 [Salvelinus fontinalis]